MDPLVHTLALWALFIGLAEYVCWRIFYRRTVRICFLTEPDLPLSRFLTIGSMRVLAIGHALFVFGIVTWFHVWLW